MQRAMACARARAYRVAQKIGGKARKVGWKFPRGNFIAARMPSTGQKQPAETQREYYDLVTAGIHGSWTGVFPIRCPEFYVYFFVDTEPKTDFGTTHPASPGPGKTKTTTPKRADAIAKAMLYRLRRRIVICAAYGFSGSKREKLPGWNEEIQPLGEIETKGNLQG